MKVRRFWVTGRIPKSLKIVVVEWYEWYQRLDVWYFSSVIRVLVEKSYGYVCIVCKKKHLKKPALVDCLKLHRSATVKYFLWQTLAKIPRNEVGQSW